MRLYEHQTSGTVDRARSLRREATDAETWLWRGLRQAMPKVKWRRQVPVGPYFADFLSFRAKSVVEVDGGQHAGATAYDERRTRFIEGEGCRVIRVWNTDVMGNLPGVLEFIASEIPLPSGEVRGEGDGP